MSKVFIVAKKELYDYFSSFRYVMIFLVITILIGLSTYSAYSRIQLEQASFLTVITSAHPKITTIMGYVGSLLGISLGFDAINREKKDRTLLLTLSCPIFRDTLLTGKFLSGIISIAVTVILSIVLASGSVIALTGILPSQEEVSRLLFFTLLSFVYILGYYSISLFFSVIVDNLSISLLLSIMFWVVNAYIIPSIAWTIASILAPGNIEQYKIVSAWVMMFSVNQHYDATSVCLLNPRAAYRLLLSAPWSIPIRPLSLIETLYTTWPSILVIFSVTIASIIVSYMIFLTKEIV